MKKTELVLEALQEKAPSEERAISSKELAKAMGWPGNRVSAICSDIARYRRNVKRKRVKEKNGYVYWCEKKQAITQNSISAINGTNSLASALVEAGTAIALAKEAIDKAVAAASAGVIVPKEVHELIERIGRISK